MLRVMRATFRGPAGPLPQVHPGKWYPSAGTWPVAVGDFGRAEADERREDACRIRVSQYWLLNLADWSRLIACSSSSPIAK